MWWMKDVTETLVDLRPLGDLLDLTRELVGSAAAGFDRQMLSVDHDCGSRLELVWKVAGTTPSHGFGPNRT